MACDQWPRFVPDKRAALRPSSDTLEVGGLRQTGQHVRRHGLSDAVQRLGVDGGQVDVGRRAGRSVGAGRAARGATGGRRVAGPRRERRAGDWIAEVLLEPAEQRVEVVEDLAAEAVAIRRHRDELVLDVPARQVRQHELSRKLARGAETKHKKNRFQKMLNAESMNR